MEVIVKRFSWTLRTSRWLWNTENFVFGWAFLSHFSLNTEPLHREESFKSLTTQLPLFIFSLLFLTHSHTYIHTHRLSVPSLGHERPNDPRSFPLLTFVFLERSSLRMDCSLSESLSRWKNRTAISLLIDILSPLLPLFSSFFPPSIPSTTSLATKPETIHGLVFEKQTTASRTARDNSKTSESQKRMLIKRLRK